MTPEDEIWAAGYEAGEQSGWRAHKELRAREMNDLLRDVLIVIRAKDDHLFAEWNGGLIEAASANLSTWLDGKLKESHERT